MFEQLIKKVIRGDKNIWRQADKMKGVLLDNRPKSKREINILTLFISEGIVSDIKNYKKSEINEFTFVNWITKIQERTCISVECAVWAITCWVKVFEKTLPNRKIIDPLIQELDQKGIVEKNNEIFDLNENIIKIRSVISSKEKAIRDITKQVQTLETEKRNIETQSNDVQKKLKNVLNEKKEQLQQNKKEIFNLNNRIIISNEDIKKLNSIISNNEREINHLNNKISKNITEINNLNSENNQLNKYIEYKDSLIKKFKYLIYIIVVVLTIPTSSIILYNFIKSSTKKNNNIINSNITGEQTTLKAGSKFYSQVDIDRYSTALELKKNYDKYAYECISKNLYRINFTLWIKQSHFLNKKEKGHIIIDNCLAYDNVPPENINIAILIKGSKFTIIKDASYKNINWCQIRVTVFANSLDSENSSLQKLEQDKNIKILLQNKETSMTDTETNNDQVKITDKVDLKILKNNNDKEPIKESKNLKKIYDTFGFPVGVRYKYCYNDKDYSIENYSKQNFKKVEAQSTKNETLSVDINSEALEYFKKMKEKAQKDGISLIIITAYISYSYQKKMKIKYKNKAEEPGYSEHHLGTAINLKGVYFDNIRYKWLKENAYKFGFILSYYRGHNISSIKAFPNQWRYIGLKEAKQYYRKNSGYY